MNTHTMKEMYFDGLFETVVTTNYGATNSTVKVTNQKLERVLKKHFKKFQSQIEWDEYLNSAMAFTWLQIQSFEGDWGAILTGSNREENKLMSAISQRIYYGTMEQANPDSKFTSSGIIEIDFISLNDTSTNEEGYTLEVQDTQELESFFQSKQGYAETPFNVWFKENKEKVLPAHLLEFYENYITCLDNSKEEVESKTGVPHKQISRKVSRIKDITKKEWEKVNQFEQTHLFQEMTAEKIYMEEMLEQDFDFIDFPREIAGDMTAGNKLGNLVLDSLGHQELILLNKCQGDKQLVYKIVQLMITRINSINEFLQLEQEMYSKKQGVKKAKVKRLTPRKTGDCKVYNKDGKLIQVIPAKGEAKSKVKKIDPNGNIL